MLKPSAVPPQADQPENRGQTRRVGTAHQTAARSAGRLAGPLVGPLAVPLTVHPVVKAEALVRYREDEALRLSAERVRDGQEPSDVLLLKRQLARTYDWYLKGRGLVLHHAYGLVPPRVREQRAAGCRGCTNRIDRGDGLMFCRVQAKKCRCVPWFLSSLPWLIRLAWFKCPIGKFGRYRRRRPRRKKGDSPRRTRRRGRKESA